MNNSFFHFLRDIIICDTVYLALVNDVAAVIGNPNP